MAANTINKSSWFTAQFQSSTGLPRFVQLKNLFENSFYTAPEGLLLPTSPQGRIVYGFSPLNPDVIVL